jgi:hypothetical protein
LQESTRTLAREYIAKRPDPAVILPTQPIFRSREGKPTGIRASLAVRGGAGVPDTHTHTHTHTYTHTHRVHHTDIITCVIKALNHTGGRGVQTAAP